MLDYGSVLGPNDRLPAHSTRLWNLAGLRPLLPQDAVSQIIYFKLNGAKILHETYRHITTDTIQPHQPPTHDTTPPSAIAPPLIGTGLSTINYSRSSHSGCSSMARTPCSSGLSITHLRCHSGTLIRPSVAAMMTQIPYTTYQLPLTPNHKYYPVDERGLATQPWLVSLVLL